MSRIPRQPPRSAQLQAGSGVLCQPSNRRSKVVVTKLNGWIAHRLELEIIALTIQFDCLPLLAESLI